MGDMEKNVNGVGRDLKEAFRTDMKEGVQEIKKYINEGRETEAISKRNGELFFIGFYFVLNLFMNWELEITLRPLFGQPFQKDNSSSLFLNLEQWKSGGIDSKIFH